MQKLAEICVRRPVFATMLIMALVVMGVFSYNRLTVERFPRVEFPTITVTTRLPGAAPQEVETEITDKIEQAVNTISGIDELRSVSTEGVSQVFVTFEIDRELDSAAQDVRDKINTVIPLLPRTIDQPTVEKLDPDAAPIMTISIASSRSVREMTEFADKVLRRQLETDPLAERRRARTQIDGDVEDRAAHRPHEFGFRERRCLVVHAANRSAAMTGGHAALGDRRLEAARRQLVGHPGPDETAAFISKHVRIDQPHPGQRRLGQRHTRSISCHAPGNRTIS